MGLYILMGAAVGPVFYLLTSLVLVVLLVLSAMISGSEIALFSLNSEDIDDFKNSEIAAEQRAVKLVEKPQMLLATILIFNNLVNISIVTLSTYITWQMFGTRNPEGLVIVLLTLIVTVLLLFFGELLPKVYASQYNRSFIHRTVFLIDFAFVIFRPLAYLLVLISNIVEKRIERKGYKIHLDELPEFIDEMPMQGDNVDREKEILKGIVNFSSTSVQEIMTSRHEIIAFEMSMPFRELIEKVQEHGYSRIPIYRETIDKIEGVLYVKDLLPFLDTPDNFKWNKLLRERLFVPKNKKIDKLLRDFQDRHVHLAIVADEYGGTAGLVTLEDIIEEIVGEINDEFDESEDVLMYTQLDERNFLFEGKIPLNDVCKVLKVNADYFYDVRGESKSLGGLILELFSRFPQLNEEITYGNFSFTIMSVSKKKIKVVKVSILDKEMQTE